MMCCFATYCVTYLRYLLVKEARFALRAFRLGLPPAASRLRRLRRPPPRQRPPPPVFSQLSMPSEDWRPPSGRLTTPSRPLVTSPPRQPGSGAALSSLRALGRGGRYPVSSLRAGVDNGPWVRGDPAGGCRSERAVGVCAVANNAASAAADAPTSWSLRSSESAAGAGSGAPAEDSWQQHRSGRCQSR